MLIGLVADTHLPRRGRHLPRALLEGLRGVDLLLHLGDFTGREALLLLEGIAPLDGVAGNNDSSEIRARFPRRKIIEAESVRLGLVHGDGKGHSTLERALSAFEGEDLDAILFGHSHSPYCVRHGKTWLINPGSPTDKRRQARYSYGVLAIDQGHLAPSLHFFD